MLYAARDFYRFRKQFWASVTTLGRRLPVALAASANDPQPADEPRRSGAEPARARGAVPRRQDSRSCKSIRRFRAIKQRERRSCKTEATLQTALDQFKIQLGLPPRIPIELDDSVLNPFVLVDPKLDAFREQIDVFQQARYRDLDTPPTVADLRSQYAEFDGLVRACRATHRGRSTASSTEWAQEARPIRFRTMLGARGQRTSNSDDVAGNRSPISTSSWPEAKTAAGGLAEAKRKEDWETLVGTTRGC